MKTIFNKQKRSVVGALIAMMAFTTALTGCQKDFELDLPLAVTSRELSLDQDSGSTHVLVYSTGEWTARFTRDVKWASLDRQKGYGNSEIVFTYAANYGISRKVGVVFEKGNLADTVMFSQAGAVAEPSLEFTKAAVTLLKAQSPVFMGISTNLRYSLDDIVAKITYYDEDGNANDPVEVPVTRVDEETGEEVEGGGEDEPQAKPVDPWISNVKLTYKGVSFDITENASNFPRRADMTLSIADAKDEVSNFTLSVTQGIAVPTLKLDSQAETYNGVAQECLIPVSNTNLVPYADQLNYDVTYAVPVEEGSEWILKPTLTDEGLKFSLPQNDGTEARKATINVNYTDALGNAVSATCEVTQSLYPDASEFSEVRALTPGQIALNGYIEGFIISDPGSKNVISAPQTKQFFFDITENDRTAYIESLDGRYGFCLQFESAEDNVLARYTRVKISLPGLTLVKETDPDRYTITGLTAANILETKVPDVFKVPVKNKTIAELTDDDIFTLVSVSNLEILQKDGAYTNCTEGYSFKNDINPIGTTTAPRWDTAPLMCYDNTGNTIYMLTNGAVPWRRFSSGRDIDFYSVVAQGSGTFRGVVVADDVAPVRFGDLGRYQLRAMVEEDIALNEEPFAQTIVEWNWNDRTVDTVPEIGSGSIDVYGATTAGASDFNNVVCSGPGNGSGSGEQKGLVPNGGLRIDNTWWDFANSTGKYFDISFSTSGISGSDMLFGIVWGTGDMGGTNIKAPANWNLLYSVDGGVSFKQVDNNPIKLRCIVWWTTTPQDVTPGFTEHLRRLPDECFGKEKVVLRLQAADTVTNINPTISSTEYWNNLAVEKGTITSSMTAANQQIRIGTITVRYN